MSIERKFFNIEIDGDRNLEVLVVSPGGVATTFLLNYLNGFVSVNDPHDGDGLKHLPGLPLMREGEGVKVLFISGDPNDVYASIKRRGWVEVQGAKLGSLMTVVLRGGFQKYMFIRSVKAQERRWRQCGVRDLLFIDYDEIWENVEKIGKFIGIDDEGFVKNFPPKRPRKSKSINKS